MAKNVAKPNVAWPSQGSDGYARTLWRHRMTWITEQQEARKAQIKAASVHYPAVVGNIRDLPPLTSINQFFTVERVRAAISLLKHEAAPGYDHVTVGAYGSKADLDDLVRRVRSMRYHPGPLRRVDIPKPDGTTRPLGIPCVEDRVVQRTWLLIVEQVFERMFLDCSYGYRPDRNCHQALMAIAIEIEDRGNLWVLDADFSKYFDSVSHRRLMSILRRTIADPVFLSFCERTLRVDVINGKVRIRVRKGTPQGSVISPLFANVFAHWVVDVFFEMEIRPRLHGWARIFRYADDFVVLTESKEDAELAHVMINARVTEWCLKLHPGKTSVHDLSCPGLHPLHEGEAPRELRFLGYETYWRQNTAGTWKVWGRTAPGRVEKALERWRITLDELVAEWTTTMPRKPRSRSEAHSLTTKLFETIWNHVKGFGGYYKAEGNEPEIRRYEEAVFRDAAAFWRRFIDAKGLNPFEEPTDRIWATIQMRPMRELSE